MSSEASNLFFQNKKDIEMLWHIHAEVAGAGRGRKHRVDVLNRAAIVFTSACWESYIEDVAKQSFDYLLTHATGPDTFPAKVKTLASKEIREDKDERRVWELADLGWKRILTAHRDTVLDKWLKDFNTPKAKQVGDLFTGLIDLPDVTANWTWQAMSAEQARTKLNDYMTMRGNIAHRTKHIDAVSKSSGKDFVSHVVRLVEKTDETIESHLASLTNTSPW